MYYNTIKNKKTISNQTSIKKKVQRLNGCGDINILKI